ALIAIAEQHVLGIKPAGRAVRGTKRLGPALAQRGAPSAVFLDALAAGQRRKLPAEIDSVGEADMKPETARRRVLMRGVAGEKDTAAPVLLGHALAPLPRHGRKNVVVDRNACETPNEPGGVERPIGREYRKSPQLLAVDADQLAPAAAGIGKAEEPHPAFAVNLHEPRRAKEQVVARR